MQAIGAELKERIGIHGACDKGENLNRAGLLNDEQAPAAIAGISQPLLYLWGDDDPFARSEKADALAALSSNSMIEPSAIVARKRFPSRMT